MLVLFPGPAEDALSAALELLQFVDQQRASHREPSRLDAALALHAGAVTLIAVGTDQELAVVSVSETVEVTRRLGRLTGRYGAALVLSESVRVQLPSPPGVQLVEIDRLEVGDGPPLTIHEVTQERG